MSCCAASVECKCGCPFQHLPRLREALRKAVGLLPERARVAFLEAQVARAQHVAESYEILPKLCPKDRAQVRGKTKFSRRHFPEEKEKELMRPPRKKST